MAVELGFGVLVLSVLGGRVRLFFEYGDVAFEENECGGAFVISEVQGRFGGDLGVVGQLNDILKIVLLVELAEELVAPEEVLGFLLVAGGPVLAVLAE